MFATFAILTLLICILGLLLALFKGKRDAFSADMAKTDSYFLRKTLLSPAERSLLGVLESIGFEDVNICCKVRLADIVGVKKGLAKGEWRRAFNRVSAKHVDFLIVSKSAANPIVAVELDDASHEKEERVDRDALVDSVCQSAGLPMVHVAARHTYDPKLLQKAIEEAVSGTKSVK